MNVISVYLAVPLLLAAIELLRMPREGHRREIVGAFSFLLVGIALSGLIALGMTPASPFFGLGVVLEPFGRWLQAAFGIETGGAS